MLKLKAHRIKPLLQNLIEDSITVLDVGSKDGVFKLKALKDYIISYGLEPNQTEFNKLQGSSKEVYYPYALSEQGGEQQINITNNASYSSF